jgi:hypothetical protein
MITPSSLKCEVWCHSQPKLQHCVRCTLKPLFGSVHSNVLQLQCYLKPLFRDRSSIIRTRRIINRLVQNQYRSRSRCTRIRNGGSIRQRLCGRWTRTQVPWLVRQRRHGGLVPRTRLAAPTMLLARRMSAAVVVVRGFDDDW